MGVLPAVTPDPYVQGLIYSPKTRLTNHKFFKNMKKERIIALTKTAMRLTFLYALITSIVVFSTHAKEADAQGVLDKRIELSAKRVTIKQMIATLEEQSGVPFIYSSSTIRADRKIKMGDLYGDLSAVLNQVFRPMGIGYKIENEKVLLFNIFQDITIT